MGVAALDLLGDGVHVAKTALELVGVEHGRGAGHVIGGVDDGSRLMDGPGGGDTKRYAMRFRGDLAARQIAPADLFNRTFNGRFAEIDGTVILASAFITPAYRRYRRLTCAGDVLAPRNKEYRQRVARALGLSETGLGEIVQRFRQKYRALRETSPFDEDELGLPALTGMASDAASRRAAQILQYLKQPCAWIFHDVK